MPVLCELAHSSEHWSLDVPECDILQPGSSSYCVVVQGLLWVPGTFPSLL